MEKDANEVIDQVVLIATTYGIDVIGALVILIVGWMAAGWARRVTEKALGKSQRIDTTLQKFFGSLVRYAVIVFTVLAVLQQFGVHRFHRRNRRTTLLAQVFHQMRRRRTPLAPF